jgi:uncharacterized protein (TIGR02145 family)
LVDYVGGRSTAGTKLKAQSPDWNGTDDHGFSALPGGSRYTDGSFYGLGFLGAWWSATEVDASYAWGRCMLSGAMCASGRTNESLGFSVRCLQDD